MAVFSIVLAAGFDWLEALLPALFVFIWIVSQVISVFRRVTAASRRDEEDDEDEDEIEVGDMFGRQRNGVRRCHGCGHLFAAPAAALMDCPECGRLTLNRQSDDPDADDDLPVQIDADSLEAEIDAFLGRGRKPPPLPPPQQPARRLVEPVAAMLAAAGSRPSGDSEMTQHIHDVFDQGLERLPEGEVENPWADLEPTQGAKRAAAVDASRPDQAAVRTTAGSLVSMLKNPATIRQAFVLREVLDRPTDRWR